ncbi:hypothetical protein GCM10027290_63630 [Micromonospora sonneratiae]|uniref:KR domain-containing protein n=1 Tax=Micromonospora sonneratiae TaxID=1184706 RepID=A0ABW3YJW1_9ACTN
MSLISSRPTTTTLRALAPYRLPVELPRHAVRWHTQGPADHPLIRHLRAAPYPRQGPRATLVALGDTWRPELAGLIAGAVDTARHDGRRVTLVHTGAGGGSLLRGLAAEHQVEASCLQLLSTGTAALRSATTLLASPPTTDDLLIDDTATVGTTGWRPVPLPPPARLHRDDLVLVTGGLGGLGLAVAAGIASAGAVPVLVDRRGPEDLPPHLTRRLGLLRHAAPDTRIIAVDLGCPERTRRLLGGLAPSSVVHCAGQVAGGTGRTLDTDTVTRLVTAKVDTLHNTVAAIDPRRLTGVIAFGSVTAYGAHPGLGGYALANELLRRAMARLATAGPARHWCTVEWSLWSGAGMARQVARTAARRLGMVPVPVRRGVAATVDLVGALRSPEATSLPGALLVAGVRAGAQGSWARRPEGLPGIDAELVVPPGADLDAAVTAVSEAAAPWLRSPPTGRPAGRVGLGSEALLVRASVHGDRVECTVAPAADPTAPPIRHYRFSAR